MEMFSKMGAVMATVYLVRSIAKEFLPPEFYIYFSKLLHRFVHFFTSYITIVIDENEGGFKASEIYEAVQTYLSSRSSSSANRLRLNRPKNAKEFTFTMDKNEQIEDEFEGIKVWWHSHIEERKQQMPFWYSVSDERRSFELKFHKRDKRVLDAYLKHVIAEAKLLEIKNRHRKIYTNKGGNKSYDSSNNIWTPVVFDHPATFQTLALDPETKDDIVRDLKKFSQREKYYKKVGRAWKRGYLLYGPPGTGKSSMIAAMANFLEYDIYDLELTEVKSNTELRKLLIATSNKSIIVIEDIDCSLDLSDRKKKPKKENKEGETLAGAPEKPEDENQESKVTLSGVLNFTDGLWSCCGSERIIIFTTNHVDRLDPALLRSGRMDKHIHLSFCGFAAFKVLAGNYLGVDEHPLFEEVESLLKDVQITPADVGEELMRASDEPSSALQNLIQALKKAKEKAAAAKEEKMNEEGSSCVAEESSMASAVPTSDSNAEKPPEVAVG